MFCWHSLHILIAKPLLSEQMLLCWLIKIGKFSFICITNSQSKENSLVCISISNLKLVNGCYSLKNEHANENVLPVLTYYHRCRTVEGWGQAVHLFRATAGHRADRGTSRGVGTFDRNNWKKRTILLNLPKTKFLSNLLQNSYIHHSVQSKFSASKTYPLQTGWFPVE